MSATFTFAASVDGNVIGTRTSGTMAYTHAVGFPRDETPGVSTWHKSFAAAQAAASKQGGVPIEVEVIKVNGTPHEGQTLPNSDELAVDAKQRLGAHGKMMAALVASEVTATVDPEGPVLSKLAEVEVEQPVTEVSSDGDAQDVEVPAETPKAKGKKGATKKATPVTPPAPKADVAPKTAQVTDRERKQHLGRQLHAAVAAFDFDLPEGMSADEAKVIVTKWLSYIPTGTK